MSFWTFNAGDAVADWVRPGWDRSGAGMGIQTAAPTFLKLVTSPRPASPYDPAAFGEFLLSRERTHSFGLLNPPAVDSAGGSFHHDATDFAEWASLENSGGPTPDRWHLVCKELWQVDGESESPARPRGWWAFWGQWKTLGFLEVPLFVYGNNFPPDDDPWNPLFGGRLPESRGIVPTPLGMPLWVDVTPWYP